MHGTIRDYTCVFASLDFHHVGILTSKESLPLVEWDCSGFILQFECHCYLTGRVEFVVPTGGKLFRSLKNSGDRLHHIAFSTAGGLERVCRDLSRIGFEFLTRKPTRGIGGMQVQFIKPKDRGVLIELVD